MAPPWFPSKAPRHPFVEHNRPSPVCIFLFITLSSLFPLYLAMSWRKALQVAQHRKSLNGVKALYVMIDRSQGQPRLRVLVLGPSLYHHFQV